MFALESTNEKCKELPAGQKHSSPLTAAMTEDLDTGVGCVLDAVEQLGIADNSYIVYTVDNGADLNMDQVRLNGEISSCEPLNKGKFWLYEGGVRVPMIIAAPTWRRALLPLPALQPASHAAFDADPRRSQAREVLGGRFAAAIRSGGGLGGGHRVGGIEGSTGCDAGPSVGRLLIAGRSAHSQAARVTGGGQGYRAVSDSWPTRAARSDPHTKNCSPSTRPHSCR